MPETAGEKQIDGKTIPKSYDITRERILTAGAVAGMTALAVGIVKKEIEEIGVVNLGEIDRISVGGMTVTPFITEHTDYALTQMHTKLRAAVYKHREFIVEYFPPEYDELRKKSSIEGKLLRMYDSINVLFDAFATYIKERSIKDGVQYPIWVIDPAYGEEFIKFRGYLSLESLIESLIEGGLLAGLLPTKEDLTRIKEFDVSSRRKFFKAIGKVIAGFMIGTGISPIFTDFATLKLSPGSFLEKDFRRVIIATGLKKLGTDDNHMTPPENPLLIYPKGHWDVIKYYLDHDDVREERFFKYKLLVRCLGLDLDNMLVARCYGFSESQGWGKLHTIPIS